MKSGMLSNWYLQKIIKSKTPMEYILSVQDFMLYQVTVIGFNQKDYFSRLSDK